MEDLGLGLSYVTSKPDHTSNQIHSFVLAEAKPSAEKNKCKEI